MVTTAAWASPLHASKPARELPPSSRAALAKIFDPKLEKFGLRTTRARLQEAPTYETNPRGHHLAIYVEPIDDSYAASAYVLNFAPVADVFLPEVFERWPALRSFDVCQEQIPSADKGREPPPVTQIAVTRKGARQITWRGITLSKLLALDEPVDGPRRLNRKDFYILLTSELRAQPAYQKALDER